VIFFSLKARRSDSLAQTGDLAEAFKYLSGTTSVRTDLYGNRRARALLICGVRRPGRLGCPPTPNPQTSKLKPPKPPPTPPPRSWGYIRMVAEALFVLFVAVYVLAEVHQLRGVRLQYRHTSYRSAARVSALPRIPSPASPHRRRAPASWPHLGPIFDPVGCVPDAPPL
jgi:hypothetical protein